MNVPVPLFVSSEIVAFPPLTCNDVDEAVAVAVVQNDFARLVPDGSAICGVKSRDSRARRPAVVRRRRQPGHPRRIRFPSPVTSAVAMPNGLMAPTRG